MENVYTMGVVIREKRKELNLTQKELAEKIGVSDKAVSKWERGESLPDVTLIPLIAVTLDVSIDYLMTGREYTDTTAERGEASQTEYNVQRDRALHSAYEIAQNKVNVLYTIFIFILLAVLVCFWFVDITFGGFVRMFDLIYVPVVYIFVILALYTIFAAVMRTKRTALKAAYGSDIKGSLNVVMAVLVAGAVFMMIYTYSSPTLRNDDSIIRFVLSEVQFPVSERYSLRYSGGYIISLPATVYFGAVAAATVLSKKNNAFGKNVITATAVCLVMAVIHCIYAISQQVYIYYKKEFLYTVWLKTTAVREMLHNVRTANIIYAAAMVVLAVAVSFIILKDKKQRTAQIIVLVAFAVYLGVSAFGFINTGYSGEGAYYAQFVTKSITAAFMFIPACPHIVMALNALVADRKE